MDGIDRSAKLVSPLALFLKSSIGKKQIMAVSGLMLCGFLVAHLLGNFLLLAGPEAFNLYAHRLTSTPLIYLAEAGLLVIFLIHFFIAMNLTITNKLARGQSYYLKNKTGEGANFFSRTMPITGILVLIFLITHLIHFKYGTYYSAVVENLEVRDIYRTVMEYFQNPWNTGWYLAAMFALCFHLFHGVQSTFQSLGFNNPKWNCYYRFAGRCFGIITPAGFAILCLWCHFKGI